MKHLLIPYLTKLFYLEYIENSQNSAIRTQTTQVFKWAKELNRYFIKEDIQMANKHMKMPNIISHGDIQIKITIRYYYIHQLEWFKFKKTSYTKFRKNMKKLEPSTHLCCGGNAKWCNHFGKHYGSFLKSLTYTYHIIQPLGF